MVGDGMGGMWGGDETGAVELGRGGCSWVGRRR